VLSSSGDEHRYREGDPEHIAREWNNPEAGTLNAKQRIVIMSSPISNHTGRVHLDGCTICGSKRIFPKLSAHGWTIAQCSDCGLQFSNPQPSDQELGDIYGADYFLGGADVEFEKVQTELKRATAAEYIQQLKRYDGNLSGRLLEVGSGSGDFLVVAAENGFDVTGVEYSADACATARARLPKGEVIKGELQEQTFAENSFDVCVMFDVIEHVRNPAKTLQIIHRLLKPGGVICIATPSTDSWSAKLMGKNWMEFKPEHLTYFGRETMARGLTSSGFDALETSPGYKFVNLEYVTRHFEKFRVPGFTPCLKLLRKLVPHWMQMKPMRVVASGLLSIARKAKSELSSPASCN
jgi:SAM-dependent methyltransferase